ncbi:MAG: NAD(P)H-binding protein [Xanthomonadales bacterium]|jgi:uncharacterized protein YbjT (DUF2867 family)|nr:NAD(P)H-binding protein [Xanthomonadales bacterium]
MTTTLVIGATGTVGTALVPDLKARGHDVRRATRTPRAPGDVAFDLRTGAGLDAALQGVDRLFLLAPPGHTDQDRLLVPLIDAAVRHGVGKVVLMTAMGVDADPSAPLSRVEAHLRQSGIPAAIIRPNWFMQNFHTFWMGAIAATGEVQLPVGDAKASFIDARDIAAVAAVLLDRPDHEPEAYDLTGPEALDHATAAQLISAAAGRTIGFRDIDPDAMRQALHAAGLPADYSESLLVILGYLKLGYAERTTPHVAQLLGRPARDFAGYARDYAGVWRV